MQKRNIMNEYLEGKIEIEELVHFFDTYNYTKEEIKAGGIVYTPKHIADYIVGRINPTRSETIFEPSVGHGIFIFSILEKMQSKYLLDSNELKKYFLEKVYATDIEERNIVELKELCVLYFKKQGVVLNIKEIKNIKVADTLKISDSFDIIVGNPPYIRVQNLKDDYVDFLKAEYKSCKSGNIDIYYAFMEFAKNRSKKFGFIVPNSWINNVGAGNLREILKSSISEVVDFKEKKVFDTASTYTSIVISKSENASSFLEVKNSLNEDVVKIDRKKLGKNRWILSVVSEATHVKEFGVIKFHTPIATLRDKIFITSEKRLSKKDVIPFFKLSKVKTKNELVSSVGKIIFPYEFMDGKYKIKSEKSMGAQTLAYLNKNRDELNKRDNGNTKRYEAWYAYGRKQGLNVYGEATSLIIVPGMIGESYNFFSVSREDLPNEFLFSSGFLLEVGKQKEKKVLEYLNGKEFKNVLKSEGKVWKGSGQNPVYYSVSITQLKTHLV